MMAASLASRGGIPLAVDLYDNFESYPLTRLPGVTWGLKHGIHQATVVSTVSDDLAAKVKGHYGAPGVVRTITNAICPEIFYPGDKLSARRRLGLPESGILIGTAGALTRRRGVETLYRAFEKLAAKDSNAYLILAGQNDRSSSIPKTDRIRYLGELPHSDVGDLFRALDVGVIYNRRDEFGIYCFPQKFYEMVACRLPVVAANVGVMTKMGGLQETCLFDPAKPENLAAAIERQLILPHVPNVLIPTWQSRGLEFQQLLEEALRLSRKAHIFGTLDQSHIGEESGQ
jgi:glycosyltransferase involved in cell wall biosynthesis